MPPVGIGPPETELRDLLGAILADRGPEETEALLSCVRADADGAAVGDWIMNWLLRWLLVLGPAEAEGYVWTAQACDAYVEDSLGGGTLHVEPASRDGRVRGYVLEDGKVCGFSEWPGSEGCDRWIPLPPAQVREAMPTSVLMGTEGPF